MGSTDKQIMNHQAQAAIYTHRKGGPLLVIGNWKMYGDKLANQHLLEQLLLADSTSQNTIQQGANTLIADTVQYGVCVPFPYLYQLQQTLNGSVLTWGAQDLSLHEQGAYTSEVSAAMLRDFACTWVLIGHSERRQYFAETDQQVASKAVQALKHGLRPIVCVGESLAQRQAGDEYQVITQQLRPVLDAVAGYVECEGMSPWQQQLVIAYEPVWAIGTGLTATPEQAQAMHDVIINLLAQYDALDVPVLYGGSVKPDNVAALFAMPSIHGALVGGASLNAQDFMAIVSAARQSRLAV